MKGIFIFLTFIGCLVFSNINAEELHPPEAFQYYAEQGDLYGAQTEILYHYYKNPKGPWKERLAEVSFLLGDIEKLEKQARTEPNSKSADYLEWINFDGGTGSVGIKTAQEILAKYNLESSLIDERKAKRLSYYFPGAGLWYAGEEIKAIGSFFVTGGLLYYGVKSLQNGDTPVGLIALFFAYQFYEGGSKAAVESAERHNFAITRAMLGPILENEKIKILEDWKRHAE